MGPRGHRPWGKRSEGSASWGTPSTNDPYLAILIPAHQIACLALSPTQTVYQAVTLCYDAADKYLFAARSANEKRFTQGIFESSFRHRGRTGNLEQNAGLGIRNIRSSQSVGNISRSAACPA